MQLRRSWHCRPAAHGLHTSQAISCPAHQCTNPRCNADKLIKSGNSLLSVGPGGGLLWSTSATLDSRIIIDTILDGDSIDDLAHVCSDAAKKAYG